MRWKSKAKTCGELEQWHPWFAWYPVYHIDSRTWMWLETVNRRLVWHADDYDNYYKPWQL
ncbi:MAG TPA: hypothetical protein VIY48_01095 [Candidatus Paceibacterota bacterium]